MAFSGIFQPDFSPESMDYCFDGKAMGTDGSDSASFFENGTDCAVTEGTGSWMVVQNVDQDARHRSYSNESNVESAASDRSCLSVAREGGADWDHDPYHQVQEDTSIYLHGGLSNSGSQSGVQTPASGSEEPPYQDNQETYSTFLVDPREAFELGLEPYLGKEDCWNPLDHRVPQFTPAFLAFAPASPPDSLITGSSSNCKAKSSRRTKNSSRKISTSTKETDTGEKKAKNQNLEWEHTVISKDGLQRVSENSNEDFGQRSFGVRKGALDPKAKEKAGRVRRVKACWNCWVLKVPCSEGETCERCIKHYSKCSPTADKLCSRTGFGDYEAIFFPEYLHTHLRRAEVEGLFNDHTDGFTDMTLDVELSTGSVFKPMQVAAHVFRPKNTELLRLHHVANSRLICQDSAPLGLMAISTSALKRLCSEHIEEMIDNPRYAAQVTVGNTTDIPYLMLEAIITYNSSIASPLLHSALKLHACQYFMASLVTFSDASAINVHQTVPPFHPTLKRYFSSRLLNRQVKFAMHKLHRETTKEVLEGLEKSMRQRTKDSWGPSFCSILLLCLCIEGLQTAADSFVISDIMKSEFEGVQSEYDRSQSFDVCQALEELPFHQCTRLFHDIYRSHKESNGGSREGGLNPFRSMHAGNATGFEDGTDAVVKHMYYIISNFPELLTLSRKSTLFNTNTPVGPRDIKENNTGRLAAKFLTSFFPV